MAKLHSVDFRAVGLEGLGKQGEYCKRQVLCLFWSVICVLCLMRSEQVTRWSAQYKMSETKTVETMNELMDWLGAHVPPDSETGITQYAQSIYY